MGVLPRIEALATGTDRLTHVSRGQDVGRHASTSPRSSAPHPTGTSRSCATISARSTTTPAATHVEYLFGDSITAISPDGEVTFEHAAARRFDVVVGADGLHSNVRRLVFGDEAGLTRFLGGYLAVVSVPKTLAPDGEMIVHVGVGRMAGIYTAQHLDDARALVHVPAARRNWTTTTEIPCGRRNYCATRSPGWLAQVDRWLAEVDDTPTFYFDSITQLCTGYLVAGAGHPRRRRRILPRARGRRQHQPGGPRRLRAGRRARRGRRRSSARLRGLRAGDGRDGAVVAGPSRAAPPRASFPAPGAGVWAVTRGAQLVSSLPAPFTRAVAKLNTKGVRMHDSMAVPDYPDVSI